MPNINILFIGNSYAGDALIYTPFIIEEICKKNNINVNINIGYSHISGGSINQHIDTIKTNTKNKYNYYSTSAKIWKTKQLTDIEAIKERKWDYISVQQTSKQSYVPSGYSSLKTILSYISKYSSAKKCLLIPKVRVGITNSSNNITNVLKYANEACNTNSINIVFPVGTAIENARNSSLKSVKTSGNKLTADNIHSQDGIPRLVEAYTMAQSILNIYGIKASISDSTMSINDTWVDAKNGGISKRPNCVGLTAENIKIAKQCALAAIKTPFKTTAISSTTKKTPTIKTSPSAKTGLKYNGSAQELVNLGTVLNGTVCTIRKKYWENKDYTKWTCGTSSKGTAATTYYVYYYIKGKTGYSDIGSQSKPINLNNPIKIIISK